ncbi:unnamed protein product [Sphagnum balticum]
MSDVLWAFFEVFTFNDLEVWQTLLKLLERESFRRVDFDAFHSCQALLASELTPAEIDDADRTAVRRLEQVLDTKVLHVGAGTQAQLLQRFQVLRIGDGFQGVVSQQRGTQIEILQRGALLRREEPLHALVVDVDALAESQRLKEVQCRGLGQREHRLIAE